MAEKIGLFAKTFIFLGEVRTEMTKVTWPTREQTKSYTIVVLVSTAIMCFATGIWDLGLSWVMRFVFGLL
jgi:preprotein translocase subunit SecE